MDAWRQASGPSKEGHAAAAAAAVQRVVHHEYRTRVVVAVRYKIDFCLLKASNGTQYKLNIQCFDFLRLCFMIEMFCRFTVKWTVLQKYLFFSNIL
jgi:hypothetical protein